MEYDGFNFEVTGDRKLRKELLNYDELCGLLFAFPSSRLGVFHYKNHSTLMCGHEEVNDPEKFDGALEALHRKLTSAGLKITGGGVSEYEGERLKFDFGPDGKLRYIEIDWLAEQATVDEIKKLRDIWDTWHNPGDDNPNTEHADAPLRLVCPSCGKLVKVRRVWHADVTADIGIDSDGSPYPLVDNDTYIDETGYEQHREFYCAACGEDIAKTEKELMELAKEHKNVDKD